MPFFTNSGIIPLPVGGGGGAWLLDQITPQPTAAYSTRKVKSTATNCVRLCDSGNGNSLACGFDGSDDLDQATVNTYYAGTGGGATANINGLYDQSGNGRDMLATTNSAVLRMSSVDSGAIQTMNSHPCWFLSGSAGRNAINSTLHVSDIVAASAFTIISAIRASVTGTSASDENGTLGDGGTGYFGQHGFYNKSAVDSVTAYLYDGADKIAVKAASIDTNYVAVSRLGSGTLNLWLNGSAATPVTSVGNIADLNFANLRFSICTPTNEVKILETFIYNTALSNADINTLMTAAGVTNGNIATRAGVTWTNI